MVSLGRENPRVSQARVNWLGCIRNSYHVTCRRPPSQRPSHLQINHLYGQIYKADVFS